MTLRVAAGLGCVAVLALAALGVYLSSAKPQATPVGLPFAQTNTPKPVPELHSRIGMRENVKERVELLRQHAEYRCDACEHGAFGVNLCRLTRTGCCGGTGPHESSVCRPRFKLYETRVSTAIRFS